MAITSDDSFTALVTILPKDIARPKLGGHEFCIRVPDYGNESFPMVYDMSKPFPKEQYRRAIYMYHWKAQNLIDIEQVGHNR